MQISRVRKLIYSAITGIFLFLLLEGGGQMLYYLKYGKWYRVVSMNQSSDHAPLIIEHPRIGYSLNPNHRNTESGIFINSLGFRDDEIPKNFKESTRVLVISDSCGFGWHRGIFTDQENTFPALLEKKLSSHLPGNFVVLNGSVPGYSSFEVLQTFREIRGFFEPHYLVVYVGFNDLNIAVAMGRKGNQNQKRGVKDNPIVVMEMDWMARWNRFFTHNSVAYSKLRNIFADYGSGEINVAAYREKIKTAMGNETVFGNFKKNIMAIIREARNNNSRVVLVTLGTIYESNIDPEEISKLKETFPSYEAYILYYQLVEKLNSILLELGNQKGVRLVQLDEALSRKDKARLFVDNVHFSPQGNAEVSEILFDFLASVMAPSQIPASTEERLG